MNSNQSTSTSPSPSAEAISRRAYEIWEQEGRPENCDLRHWLQAEQELNGTSGTNGTSSASSSTHPRETQASVRTDTRAVQGTRAAPPRDSRRTTTTTPFDRTATAGAVETAGAKRR